MSQIQGCLVLSDRQQIDLFRLKTIRSGLKLELAGMRHSTNAVFKAAKSLTGKRTRKDCLQSITEMIQHAEEHLAEPIE